MPSGDPIDSPARSLLDGELLRAFAAFAETRNFTRAATRIGLSQPALFERVQRLGERLGERLYTRDKRTLTLTPAGVALAAFAREALRDAAEFAERIRGSESRPTVTLAAGTGAFLYLLAAPLRRFEAHHPGVLAPVVLGGPDAAAAVARGEADLAVGVYDVLPEGLASEVLCRAPLCVALPRDHRLASRRRIRLSDLDGEAAIVSPAGQRHHEVVTRALSGHRNARDPGLERQWRVADGWPLMLSFVASGLGIAIVNGTCQAPDGVVLRPLPELGTVTYRVLRRQRVPPLVESLVRMLTETPDG